MRTVAIAALVTLAALGIGASRNESSASLPTAVPPTSFSDQTTPVRVSDDFGSARASSRPPVVAWARLAQNTAGSPTTAAAGASGVSGSNIPVCDKPGGMGLSRLVEIDTTGGPGFGFEHFKQYDFLRDREVVLTFDDGPGRTIRLPCSRRLPTIASRPRSSRSASTRYGTPKSPSRWPLPATR
jgi:hypothetical protein